MEHAHPKLGHYPPPIFDYFWKQMQIKLMVSILCLHKIFYTLKKLKAFWLVSEPSISCYSLLLY